MTILRLIVTSVSTQDRLLYEKTQITAKIIKQILYIEAWSLGNA